MRVIALNTGSTSVKASVLEVGADGATADLGKASASGLDAGAGRATSTWTSAAEVPTMDAAIAWCLAECQRAGTAAAVLHRVVHGGDHPTPAMIDDALVAEIEELAPLAPLHQPAALAGIAAARLAMPGIPHVACFDTSFFSALPDTARSLAIGSVGDPRIRRYGFHGIAYGDVVDQLGGVLGPRTVLAHLGGGMSMAALRDALPIHTTMGMTPLGGLPMMTRSGDLDPGVVLYLLRTGRGVDDVEHLLDHASGVSGVAHAPADLRAINEAAESDALASLAVRVLRDRVLMQAGAYAALLGGVDTLAFSGGVGENDARLREHVVAGLAALGLWPDVRVIAVREDHAMARASFALIEDADARGG